MKFENIVNGTIVDTTVIDNYVWCAKCGMECENEAIIKDGKPYHYNCSGVEVGSLPASKLHSSVDERSTK